MFDLDQVAFRIAKLTAEEQQEVMAVAKEFAVLQPKLRETETFTVTVPFVDLDYKGEIYRLPTNPADYQSLANRLETRKPIEVTDEELLERLLSEPTFYSNNAIQLNITGLTVPVITVEDNTVYFAVEERGEDSICSRPIVRDYKVYAMHVVDVPVVRAEVGGFEPATIKEWEYNRESHESTLPFLVLADGKLAAQYATNREILIRIIGEDVAFKEVRRPAKHLSHRPLDLPSSLRRHRNK